MKARNFVLMKNSFHMFYFPVGPFKYLSITLLSNRKDMTCSVEMPSRPRSP